ncbi:SCAN domain-containing 3-like [Brachionus plicatilis]|uniref:SCAN domain-containing 3-like n=1 Tax=Brachionus plicatilis TaxID=10195 RepID=A0A3M7SRF0_BRAPC|nr:SCAN domain-containing 3-like [Brachionus plicatilis]
MIKLSEEIITTHVVCLASESIVAGRRGRKRKAIENHVPDVDRGPADPVNTLAYITKINNHKLYQLATKHGIIKGWHARNSFQICKQKLIKFEQLDLSIERTLREINRLHSISGGQGFMK